MAESRAAAMPARSFEQIAEVSIEPRSGAAVSGGIAFDELDGLLRIHGVLTGLKPGVHGFHIHETGDCSADDAASAGGHYAPLSKNHGAPSQPVAQRHAGDLGNIVAGEDGTAAIDILVSASGPDDLGQRILGKAVVVHGAADDLTSQPSGAAGDRVGCGVIQTIS
jgi:Cu-Zn family superoxide dismutase